MRKGLRKFFAMGGGLIGIMLALFIVFAKPAAAADYTVTITDGNVARNQSIIFTYSNIGPGFSANANVNLINNSSQITEVKLISVSQDPSDPNQLLPFVQLSLSENGVVLGQGTFNSDTLIGASTCIDPNFSKQLQAGFMLPASTGNSAQNTSMRVIYTFLVTQTPCDVIAPPNTAGNPNSLPPTGETMWPFWALGGTTIIFFGLTLLFMILVFAKRRGDERETTMSPIDHKATINHGKK